MEKVILKGFINKDKQIEAEVQVPKAWFGLRPIDSITETLSLPIKEVYKMELEEILEAYNTAERKYSYNIVIYPSQQYMKFECTGQYKELVKEMTIEQIEKELGYKIKVVNDN